MQDFLATHPIYDLGPADPAIDTYVGMPQALKDTLKETRTNAYANGFFRFVAPSAFADYFPLFKLDSAECHAFLKCAFGHLVFHHGGNYKLIDPIVNTIDDFGDDLSFVLDIALCDRPALESTYLIDVYEQAFPRLGAPGVDEIYAFTPALGLGGDRSAESIRKSRMAVEMSILSQL